jgi:peptidyl-prolyl cis-trans isomerase D
MAGHGHPHTDWSVIFALWGAYGVVSSSFGPPDFALKINGERISNETLNRAWQERQAQYQQMLNGSEMSDAQKKQLQQQLIDEYVRKTLLSQRAAEAGYRVTQAQVAKAVTSEPAFQLEGKFDPRVAKVMLAQAGMTEEGYVNERRESMQVGQLNQGIELSEFMTPTELGHLCAGEPAARTALRGLTCRSLIWPASRSTRPGSRPGTTVTRTDYMSPESVKLKYAELRLDALDASGDRQAREDLQAYYDKVKSRYSEGEKRHAHHILIAVADAKDAKADAAALAKANQIEAELKGGKDFSELAKKYSADPGSAAQGGDLGWAEKECLRRAVRRCAVLHAGRADQRSGQDAVRLSHHQTGRDSACARALASMRCETK